KLDQVRGNADDLTWSVEPASRHCLSRNDGRSRETRSMAPRALGRMAGSRFTGGHGHGDHGLGRHQSLSAARSRVRTGGGRSLQKGETDQIGLHSASPRWIVGHEHVADGVILAVYRAAVRVCAGFGLGHQSVTLRRYTVRRAKSIPATAPSPNTWFVPTCVV